MGSSKGDKTEVDFTEYVTAKKYFRKPFVKADLKKQQKQFVADSTIIKSRKEQLRI